jgi:hypothetical protein
MKINNKLQINLCCQTDSILKSMSIYFTLKKKKKNSEIHENEDPIHQAFFHLAKALI